MKKTVLILITFIIMAFSVPPSSAIYRADYGGLELTEAEKDNIAKAVAEECRGRSYFVKTCVTAVILNRLLCPLLPDEVEAVSDDRAVFGEDFEEPDGDELFEASTLLRLVLENGVDPTCGALFIMRKGDDAAPFTVTLETDGLVFARP